MWEYFNERYMEQMKKALGNFGIAVEGDFPAGETKENKELVYLFLEMQGYIKSMIQHEKTGKI